MKLLNTPMRSSNNTSIFGVTFLTLGILAAFFVFGWFSVWSVLALVVLVCVVLFWGDHLWLGALLVPLSVPVGFVATLLVGRSYEYDITGVEIVLLLLSTAAMYALLWRRVQEGGHSRTEILLAAYIVLAVASLFWVQDFAKYLVAVRVAIYHFLAFFCARLFLHSPKTREWMMRTIPIVVIVISVQLLSELAHLGTIRRILMERSFIFTPVGAMAFVTATIVLLLPLVVVQYYRTTNWSRWIYFSAGVLGILAVLGSIGKAALLVMLTSLGYLFYRLNKGRMFFKRVAFAGVVLMVLAGGGSFTPSLLVERFANIAGDVSSKFRVEEARTAFGVYNEHPVFGVGAGNLKYHFQRLLNGYSGESNILPLQVAAEFGTVGLVLLGALILAMRDLVHRLDHRVTGRENRLMLIGFQASLVAAILHGFLEVTFIGLAYGVLFWLLVGMMDGWRVPSPRVGEG